MFGGIILLGQLSLYIPSIVVECELRLVLYLARTGAGRAVQRYSFIAPHFVKKKIWQILLCCFALTVSCSGFLTTPQPGCDTDERVRRLCFQSASTGLSVRSFSRKLTESRSEDPGRRSLGVLAHVCVETCACRAA